MFDLNIFYFIYMKKDSTEHRCYVIGNIALSYQNNHSLTFPVYVN